MNKKKTVCAAFQGHNFKMILSCLAFPGLKGQIFWPTLPFQVRLELGDEMHMHMQFLSLVGTLPTKRSDEEMEKVYSILDVTPMGGSSMFGYGQMPQA